MKGKAPMGPDGFCGCCMGYRTAYSRHCENCDYCTCEGC